MSKKIKTRVPDYIAKELGLEINKSTQYRLTPEQYKEKNRLLGNENTNKKETRTKEEKPFVLSAWSDKGEMMDITGYCNTYKLPREDIKSYKLVSHTGTPFYNIQFNDKNISNDGFDYIGELESQLKEIEGISFIKKIDSKGEIVATLTDFHFGAYISAMNITPEFSINILCEMLRNSANRINRVNAKKVHIHLLGDLIESFTGMNHKNSWKGLDKGMFGVSAIKLFVKLFKEHFLDLVINLESIKMVAGNHDRVTSDSTEDTDGGSAELVAWGLDMLGYDIEFKRDVLTHKVDGVNYILNHGHLGFTNKKTTQEICWMYGEKGVFNFITEGHLHSRIAKLNAKQVNNFSLILDDSIDCRRQVCPSLFTGNPYSEDGGWSTMAGFLITESSHNKKGIDVLDISL